MASVFAERFFEIFGQNSKFFRTSKFELIFDHQFFDPFSFSSLPSFPIIKKFLAYLGLVSGRFVFLSTQCQYFADARNDLTSTRQIIPFV